jgi:hypothetical protein
MTTIKDRLITFKNNLITAKSGLATAITAKGVSASGNDSFAGLVTKIENIQGVPSNRDYDILTFESQKKYDQSYYNFGDWNLKIILVSKETAFVSSSSTTPNVNLATKQANPLTINISNVSGYDIFCLLDFELMLFAVDPPAVFYRAQLEPVKPVPVKFIDFVNRKVVRNETRINLFPDRNYDFVSFDNGTISNNNYYLFFNGLINLNTVVYIPTYVTPVYPSYELKATFVCRKA